MAAMQAETHFLPAGRLALPRVLEQTTQVGESPVLMARAVLLLASEPADKINGRVTYSQQILSEYGLLDRTPTGRGVTIKGTGYSQI